MQVEWELTVEDQLHHHKEDRDNQYLLNINQIQIMIINMDLKIQMEKTIQDIAQIFKI